MEELSASGLLLRLDGVVIAFTVGAPIGCDTFDIIGEKADADIVGAYQAINQAFAAQIAENYLYINREEDMGLPGLRRAKESYHPQTLLMKHEAVWRT